MDFGDYFFDYDESDDLFNDAQPQCLPESLMNEINEEKPLPVPELRDSLSPIAPCLMPDNNGNVQSIYFSGIRYLKCFVKENVELVKDWVIVLPLEAIGQLRVDHRRKDQPSFLVSPQLIKIPQH